MILKRILKVVFPLLICLLGALVLIKSLSPFKTKEQRQVKEMYQDSFQGIHNFKLKSVETDVNNSYLYFDFKLKVNDRSFGFDEDELVSMNLAVERMIEYLNVKNNFENKYELIRLRFYAGNGRVPDFIMCSIKNVNQKYIFGGLTSKNCNDLFDFYVMKDVTSITLNTGSSGEYSDERLSKFSEHKNLREICYKSTTDMDYLKALKKGLQKVLPECKLYVDDVEVTTTE